MSDSVVDVRSEIQRKQQLAASHKAAGNEAFKVGDLQKAIKEYHHAILYLQGLDRSIMGVETNGEGKAELVGVDGEISLIYSNMAAVQLKRQNWARAIACADDALRKNAKNVKASFRKATALNASGDVQKAKRVLKEMDQSDASVKLLLAQIDKEEAARTTAADSKLRGFLNSKPKVAPTAINGAASTSA